MKDRMTQQMKAEKVRGDEKARRGKLEKQILLKRLFWLSLIYTRQHPTTNITNVVTITNEKRKTSREVKKWIILETPFPKH